MRGGAMQRMFVLSLSKDGPKDQTPVGHADPGR